MLNPRRIESDTCPPKFINLRDGTWYYNYDIKSRVAEVPIGDGSNDLVEKTRWSYIQVRITGNPEYKKCVETLIRMHITQNQEFDLINTANRVLLNVGVERTVPPEYLEYLNLVDKIKTKVKEDFQLNPLI